MTLVEVEGYQLKISAAGMPPALIYRAERKAVEEVAINSVPLGSIVAYEYRWSRREMNGRMVGLRMTMRPL